MKGAFSRQRMPGPMPSMHPESLDLSSGKPNLTTLSIPSFLTDLLSNVGLPLPPLSTERLVKSKIVAERDYGCSKKDHPINFLLTRHIRHMIIGALIDTFTTTTMSRQDIIAQVLHHCLSATKKRIEHAMI